MKHAPANEFRHTSAPTCPDHKTAIVFLSEGPGLVGVYVMDDKFRLWPARTVNLAGGQDHVETVLGAWSEKGVPTIDARALDGVYKNELRDMYKITALNMLQEAYQTNAEAKMSGQIDYSSWSDETDRIAEQSVEAATALGLLGEDRAKFILSVIKTPCPTN